MSLLIKGMEMPDFGEKIIILTSSGYVEDVSGSVIQGIEAVPVPPHGRIGDLDKLAEYFDSLEKEHPFLRFTPSAVGSILRSECYSPTFIPSEEE